MAYIREKKTKSGKYYYLVESHRVNGKVVKEETYLGTKPPPRQWYIEVPGRGKVQISSASARALSKRHLEDRAILPPQQS